MNQKSRFMFPKLLKEKWKKSNIGTLQDIGMGLSQYEMESSGVFSDADPGRKSTIEPKSVQGIPEEDKNSINEEPLHLGKLTKLTIAAFKKISWFYLDL